MPKERRESIHGPYQRAGRWRVVITAANNRRTTESFASEAEATARISEGRDEIEQRTISAAVEAYFAAEERRMTEGEVRDKTLERSRYHLRSLLRLDTAGHLDLRKFTPTYAERLYDERRGAVDTHRNALSVAKAFGAWCVKRGWLTANPFASVKGRGKRRKGKPQLRWEEARVFERTALGLADHDDGAVASLCYLLLGPRSNEVLSRQCRDVDDGGGILWTRNSKRRNGERLIRIPRQLAPFMLRLARDRKPNDPLFAHAATRARPQDWAREQVWRICKLAGVPKVGPHGLRGTLATMGKELGETSQRVADALDHASTSMTERSYIDPDRAEAAAVERGWRVLEGGRR